MSVLAVISQKSQAAALTRWAWRVARTKESRLVLLWVEKGSEAARAASLNLEDESDPQRQEGGIPEILSTLGALSGGPGEGPEVEVKRMVHSDRLEGVLREIERSAVRWLVVGQPPSSSGQGRQLGRRLFQRASCSVVLLRPGSQPEQPCARILVPSAGGPSSLGALSLGASLAGDEGGELHPLYVEQESDDLAEDIGSKILGDALRAAGLGGENQPGASVVRPRVELADSHSDGIQRVLDEGYDLVMVGASGRGLVRRTLFGTVPERLLASDTPATVAVFRGPHPPGGRLRRAIEGALDLAIPQLERDDRIHLVEKLQLQSRWSFDFLALIALSTTIAALGLLQDSAAVVIGAMLVAPLMTPLLGAGLALVQGNLPLMRTAGHAIVLGFFTAVLIGFLAGTVVPLPELTDQLASRGQPTLLDLGVAFFSGVAAAYCLGRPNLSAALPGVAIAAALVPPIATLGIALAVGDGEVAQGSAILFGTNVVAIILGAAASFFAAGIRTNRRLKRQNRWARAVLAVLVLAVALLTVPLASLLISRLAAPVSPAGVGRELRQSLEDGLGALEGAQLSSATRTFRGEAGSLVVLRIVAPEVPPGRLVEDLARRSAEILEHPVEIRLHTDLVAGERAQPSGFLPGKSLRPSESPFPSSDLSP